MDKLLRVSAHGYLTGVSTLEALQRLLITILWEKQNNMSPEGLEFAKEVDLRIAEFTGGHASEEDLKQSIEDATHNLGSDQHNALI